jgi:hypothetical protein
MAFLLFCVSWIFLARGILSSAEKFANFWFSSHLSKVLSYFSLFNSYLSYFAAVVYLFYELHSRMLFLLVRMFVSVD